jgi:integrase/recombinase XerD
MLIKKAIQQFLAHCRYSKNLSAHTLKAYAIDFLIFENFAGKKTKAQKCDTLLLRDYMCHLFETRKLKETSVKRRMASLKVLFRWMELNNAIEINPFHRLDTRIKLPRRLPRGLSRSEIRAVIQSPRQRLDLTGAGRKIKDGMDNASLLNGHFSHLTALVALELLFATGMRVGELVSIALKDIDLKESTIAIVGKGDRERRVFIPDDEVKSLLEVYIESRGARKPATETLLINSRNKPASTQFIRKLVREAGESAGLKGRVTPHMFRHSTATHLLEAGMDIRQVQRLLGHASIATTQIYTQVSDSGLKAVVCRVHPRREIMKGK